MNRTDFQILAATRRKEAKRLLDADYWDGAYYLSAYVVELALKARIAKDFHAAHLARQGFHTQYPHS